MNKNVQKGLVAAGAVIAAGSASAAGIDVTAVTAGIADASTALQTVVGALMSLSVGLFGISKVYAFIKRRAGA